LRLSGARSVPGAIMGALAIVSLEGETPADAASLIGGLVAACPELTVLATSREPLSVQAE